MSPYGCGQFCHPASQNVQNSPASSHDTRPVITTLHPSCKSCTSRLPISERMEYIYTPPAKAVQAGFPFHSAWSTSTPLLQKLRKPASHFRPHGVHLHPSCKSCTSRLPISDRMECKVACTCFHAINGSGRFYLFELLDDYALSRALRCASDSRTCKKDPIVQTQDAWLSSSSLSIP